MHSATNDLDRFAPKAFRFNSCSVVRGWSVAWPKQRCWPEQKVRSHSTWPGSSVDAPQRHRFIRIQVDTRPRGAAQPVASLTRLQNGGIVQGWTISNLKPSSDAIAYPVQGTLWEATATDQAIGGGATPIVSDRDARALSAQTYRALFGVATPQGVNPSWSRASRPPARSTSTSPATHRTVSSTTPSVRISSCGCSPPRPRPERGLCRVREPPASA